MQFTDCVIKWQNNVTERKTPLAIPLQDTSQYRREIRI
jgi:hypothetical protein